MKKSFTLIELLIVVLIVGILATVALPQYTKVVNKAKWAEAVSMLGTIRKMALIYYTEHGNPSTTYYHLNGVNKTANIPDILDVVGEDPGADGRHVYVVYGLPSYPNCAYAFIDDYTDPANGTFDSPQEQMIWISYDGVLTSANNAPEF
ncbi:MAG: prepilin-type N-terminal cleavage/methylation domain-containing protein [Candidatus Omnitrophica bacterium]|nr:prepilin-type N-terminal cleavage/methylation domain-containing protein [Candidatus Omnitrophota bacterium]